MLAVSRRALLPLLLAVGIIASVQATDGPLTTFFGLRGVTDSSGYLRISLGSSGGGQSTPLTPLANLRGVTDQNGYLRVSCSDCGSSSLTGPVTITEAVGSSGLTITGATQTTSQPALNVTQTWNAAQTFTALKLNVTSTSSNSGSLLADLQLGGTSNFSVRKDGMIAASPGAYQTLQDVLRGGTSGGNSGFVLSAGNAATNRPTIVVRDVASSEVFGADTSGIYSSGKIQLGNALTNGDTALNRSSAGLVEVNNGTTGTFRDFQARHVFAAGTAPTVGNTSANSCGTSAASIVGKDEAWAITVGATAGTSCTITFGTAYTNAPSCWATDVTGTPAVLPAVTSTTTAIISGTFTAGDVLRGGCKSF